MGGHMIGYVGRESGMGVTGGIVRVAGDWKDDDCDDNYLILLADLLT